MLIGELKVKDTFEYSAVIFEVIEITDKVTAKVIAIYGKDSRKPKLVNCRFAEYSDRSFHKDTRVVQVHLCSSHCMNYKDTTIVMAKTRSENRMCYKCASAWLKDTSRCPKCSKDAKECSVSCKYSGHLDRWIVPDP